MEKSIKEYSLKFLSESDKAKVIEIYLQEVEKCKKIICHHWFRGFCIFPDSICKYAHGISELEYQIASERPAKLKEHISDSNIFYLKHDNRNYQILKDYIEKLRNQNLLKPDEDFSLEELNADGKKRTKIRERLHKEITLEFMDFILKKHAPSCISVHFVEKEFSLIKFPIKINWIFNSDYYFVNDIPLPPRQKNTFKAVFPFPSDESLEKQFKESLVSIVNELKKNKDNDIVTEKQITTEYYKNKFCHLPPLHIVFKKLNKNLTDFIKEGEGLEEEKNCFISLKEQKEKFIQEMLILINDFWEHDSRKKFAFGKYSDLLKQIEIHNFLQTAKDIFQSLNHFYDFIRNLLIQQQYILIFLYSETFIINLNLLKKQTEDNFIESLKIKNIKSTHCAKNHLDWKDFSYVDEKNNVENMNLSEEKLVLFEKQRIIVINDLESFIYSRQILLKCKKIGVDIEGILCEGGCIDLIQIGINYTNPQRKIFIFDIHYLQKNNFLLYTQTKLFLKQIMQNDEIAKIFHDCRKDSLALHLFLDNACPKKIYDTACLHIFIENIKASQNLFQVTDENKINEILNKMENLLWPGLNVILSTYNATHGINPLKEKMKKKFGEEPRSFFLSRPINEEFLEYSAKDVEDLVEAFENQEKIIESLFFELNVDITISYVKEYLLEKISYYYAKAGCIPSFD